MTRCLCLSTALLFLPTNLHADEPLRAVIDRELKAAWSDQKVSPAAKSSDAEFLRRIYLDLVGTIPTLAETTRFLADADSAKRGKLIDALLADPRLNRAQADVWDLVLFGRNPNNADAVRTRDRFKTWLAQQFAGSVPYNRWVKELLLAEQPGTEFFHVQFRGQPEDEAVAVSRIFLGTQLHFARCHDHPYDVWTQKDFYGLAGFFVRLVVQETGAGAARVVTIGEKNSGDVLFTGSAKEQMPGRKGEPVKPRFLGGQELVEPPSPKDAKEAPPKDGAKLPKPAFSRKEKLADWVASESNPYLARAAANRLWAQFMGRGIVYPVDDFNRENPPDLPRLMTALTEGLTSHHYDLKWLVREIVSSEAYQLSGVGAQRDALPRDFARARVRPLTAEELIAAMRTATSFDVDVKDIKPLPNAGGEYFLRYFGEPTNGLGDFQGSLGEHLFLNNGEHVRGFAKRKKGNLTDQLMNSKEPWDTRIERLYLSVLNRPPKPAELAKFVSFVRDDPKPESRLEDAVWVLLNSSEFRFNH